MPNHPEVREQGTEQRLLEELDAERAARARFVADRAFDEFDMAISPLLESLIEVGHQLEEENQVGPGLVQVEESLGNDRISGREVSRMAHSVVSEEKVEGIDDGRLLEPSPKPVVVRRLGAMEAKHLGTFVAEGELEFAELHGLEPGGVIEPGAART